MVQQVPRVLPDLMVLQEIVEFQDCRDQLVLSAPGALLDRKEREEWPVPLVRRDHLALLDPRDLPDLWAPEVREERRDLLANLEPQETQERGESEAPVDRQE